MSAGTVLTLGLGAFTAGGVKFLPTLGLGTGAAPPPPSDTTKTGAGGIDPGEGRRRRNIVKPTQLLGHGKPKKKTDERIEETGQIAAEVAGRLAREFTEENASLEAAARTRAIAIQNQGDIDAEIGLLLRARIRSEEDDILLMLLMAAAACQ